MYKEMTSLAFDQRINHRIPALVMQDLIPRIKLSTNVKILSRLTRYPFKR